MKFRCHFTKRGAGRGKGETFLTSWLLPFHTRVYSYREQNDPMTANSFLEELTPVEMEKNENSKVAFCESIFFYFENDEDFGRIALQLL